MAVKSRRAYKGAAVSNALAVTLGASDVTITVNTNFSGWDTSGTPFFCVIEPGTTKEEKVCVVYTGTTTLAVVDPAATSGWSSAGNYTAGRGVDNTTAREHLAGAVIYPVFTATEADQANELVSKYAHQGALVHQGSSTFTELQIGTAGQVLKVNSGATAPEWGQTPTAGIADSAVTTAKIADSNVTAAKVATAALKLLCPVGTISAYGGTSAPTGWLLCNGSSINASYTELIALVGANTPDMQGRFPIGDNSTLTLLGTGGSLTIAEANLPSHTHGMKNHTHTIDHNHTASGSHSHTINITDPGHRHVYLRPTEGSHNVVNAADASLSFMDSYTTANSDSATTGISATSSPATVDLDNFTGTSGAPSDNTTTATGSGTNYYQPYLVVNYIIKHDYV